MPAPLTYLPVSGSSYAALRRAPFGRHWSANSTFRWKGLLMKPSEVLAKAADLIEPEGRWTQGIYAKDADGERLEDPAADGAVCWCLYGAIDRFTGQAWTHPAIDYLSITLRGSSGEAVANWNDHPERTQAEVVTALRAASELARSEGQ